MIERVKIPQCKVCSSKFRDIYERMRLRGGSLTEIYSVVEIKESEDTIFSYSALRRHLRKHMRPKAPSIRDQELTDFSEILTKNEVDDILMDLLTLFSDKYFPEYITTEFSEYRNLGSFIETKNRGSDYHEFLCKLLDNYIKVVKEYPIRITTINAIYFWSTEAFRRTDPLAGEAGSKLFIEYFKDHPDFELNPRELPYRIRGEKIND